MEKLRSIHKNKECAASETRDEFIRQLDLLWNIAALDWKDTLSNRLLSSSAKEENIAFFCDQCWARVCAIKGLGTNYQNKKKRGLKREQENEKRTREQAEEAGGSQEGWKWTTNRQMKRRAWHGRLVRADASSRVMFTSFFPEIVLCADTR